MAFEQDYINRFSIASGATGSFSFIGGPDGSPSTHGSNLSGTFNGQQITDFSQYGFPTNRAAPPTFGPSRGGDVISVQGVEALAGHVNDPAYSNGISFTLADGSAVHIFVQQDQGGNYSLAYTTSTGAAGAVSLQYTQSLGPSYGCFMQGVLIRSSTAELPVETLREGDLVLTKDGEERPVRWIGHTVLRPSREPDASKVNPIRIRAHAIAENVPARDLRVSPGHALLVGDVLINAGELVNGGTIVQEEAERVDYYHVELDSHDILIADGMPCESYLDDGNRASFLNGADHIRLHGRIDRASEATCRPLVKHGPLLVAARAALLARAVTLGWRLAERPALRLRLGDALLEPCAIAGTRSWFALPDDAPATVRLRAAAAIVNRIAPDRADDRLLAVAIGELRIDGAPVPLDAPVFGAGCHPPETDGTAAWRWTDGDAALAIGPGARMIELRLQIVLPTLCRGDDALAAEGRPPLLVMPAHAGIA